MNGLDSEVAMIACLDVDYRDSGAVAACVLLRAWADAASAGEYRTAIPRIEPYVPGQFYRRELPCLLAILAEVQEPLSTVVVDSYVWLGDGTVPGLGAHLYEALGSKVPVLGVAKTQFAGATAARPVWRGASRRALYVSAAGMDLDQAAQHIGQMHGSFRIPTLLKRVDQLCRGPDTSAHGGSSLLMDGLS